MFEKFILADRLDSLIAIGERIASALERAYPLLPTRETPPGESEESTLIETTTEQQVIWEAAEEARRMSGAPPEKE